VRGLNERAEIDEVRSSAAGVPLGPISPRKPLFKTFVVALADQKKKRREKRMAKGAKKVWGH